MVKAIWDTWLSAGMGKTDKTIDSIHCYDSHGNPVKINLPITSVRDISIDYCSADTSPSVTVSYGTDAGPYVTTSISGSSTGTTTGSITAGTGVISTTATGTGEWTVYRDASSFTGPVKVVYDDLDSVGSGGSTGDTDGDSGSSSKSGSTVYDRYKSIFDSWMKADREIRDIEVKTRKSGSGAKSGGSDGVTSPFGVTPKSMEPTDGHTIGCTKAALECAKNPTAEKFKALSRDEQNYVRSLAKKSSKSGKSGKKSKKK